jgi:carbamoyl-phosphate synthase large subunit
MHKSILITSVGSLVGQNILDALHNRRNNIKIIGTNSIAEAANNFRCDKSYLVAKAKNSKEFTKNIITIIEKEEPDIIIPGRDDDIVILAQLREKMSISKDCFLVGSEYFAKIMDDKFLSYDFALKHNLPFAPTIESGKLDSYTKTNDLLKSFGFPLIAKPSKGNGSRGIWMILNENQLKKLIQVSYYSIQPFFGHEKNLNLDTSMGLPFFWGIPENSLFAAQVIINKNQKVEEIFTFVAKMVAGKCERMDIYDNPILKEITRKFAEAAILEGWRGPFNIQLKKDSKHGFQAIEMNGRFSGGTSARYHLGFDEVGKTINDWMSNDIISNTVYPKGNKVVTKILADYPINQSNVDQLINKKVWTR